MTTSAPASSPRSRLDPEPLPRRDFLGAAALWSMVSALAVAVLGMLRLPRAAVVPTPSKQFRIELPESLPEGTPFFVPGRAVAVFRDAQGVYAVSIVCTHLGCIVKQKDKGFSCPCHGSEFAADGAVIKGPAPSALPWLAVRKAGSGWLIDESKHVDPGTRAA